MVLDPNTRADIAEVTLTFDLYIIGTWDGSGLQGFGADRWQLEVKQGRRSAGERIPHVVLERGDEAAELSETD
jgi:hypothetical protein